MKDEDKIGFMHECFGTAEGKCGECCNFKRWSVGSGRYVRKCRVYGVSRSSATDWKAGFPACGMKNVVPEGIGNMYKKNRRRGPLEESILPGQISFEI